MAASFSNSNTKCDNHSEVRTKLFFFCAVGKTLFSQGLLRLIAIYSKVLVIDSRIISAVGNDPMKKKCESSQAKSRFSTKFGPTIHTIGSEVVAKRHHHVTETGTSPRRSKMRFELRKTKM